MKNICAGILAHVDAGKTTLSEAMLYMCGSIRTLGRVDRKNAYLDNNELERARGITIFSKQARLHFGESDICLLDTPGHVDFAAETERTLGVLDCAVLVISGTDGVQAHTETLWRLLKKHCIPTAVFITKMDLPVCDRDALLSELKQRLDESCTDFSAQRDAEWYESLAMCDEDALECFAEKGTVTDGIISRMISERKLFPCVFGSGLKLDGVDTLLSVLDRYFSAPEYGADFGARVYKIIRDSQGKRLSCMKITGGTLRNRSIINGEKVTELRLYNGAKYENTDEVPAGCICAVQGLTKTFCGQGIGTESCGADPELQPVLSYRINLPKGTDPMTALPKLRQLEDEDPMLRLCWNAQLGEIRAELMGEVQTEILQSLIKERFGMDVTIDSGGIMYRETILSPVEGVGHFEPLRHYAEVHLALEPLPVGSGLIFGTVCSEDVLDRNWQNLILTHLAEKQHLGVLTGSPITDMRITLLAGRSHPKHTEGGDFRESVYRAVRQGLMSAKSRLLEPWYEFKIEVPPDCIGRAISDLRAMSAQIDSPEDRGGASVLTGLAPVSEMNGYVTEMLAYTRGKGRLSCALHGYLPCHNEEKVLEASCYDPEADLENTPDSVFCSHGAGLTVKWDKVREHMHIDTGYGKERQVSRVTYPRITSIDDKELEAIMEREFGPIRRAQYTKPVTAQSAGYSVAPTKTEYLIIDGYNLIFAWEELAELSRSSLELARERLIDRLRSYRAFRGCELVLVFDGYKVAGNPGEKTDSGSVHVVYTKENETGDMYIEKLANDIGKNYSVRVVTNDSLIRLSALRSGVLRMSSTEFINELCDTAQQIRKIIDDGKR